MPWYLYLALKQLFPTGKRFPFFTAISVTGVALGVALLVVVTSVMEGFGYHLREMIVDIDGEVQVKAQGYIEDYRAVMKRIEAVPGVAGATPYADSVVMIQYQGRPAYPRLRGLDLATVENVAHLSRYMQQGRLEDLDDDSIIVGVKLADSLGVGVGDQVEVYSPLLIEKLAQNTVFMPRTVRIAGVIAFGHDQFDTSTVYCTLRLAQDLYGLGRAVHGIDVRLKPGVDDDDGANAINAVLPATIRAFTWMDTWSDFLWVLALERNMIFFLLLFIVVVAAFSVTSSLLISVIRKTREIGLLGALGGEPRQVAACFCAQGFLIGTFGTLVGLGLGFFFLGIRNHVVVGLANLLERRETLERFYQFSELPSHPDPHYIAAIIVLTIVISTLAGAIPAWRAARLKPVEALRSE
jgi:lipoprotein-releasing system permease protein